MLTTVRRRWLSFAVALISGLVAARGVLVRGADDPPRKTTTRLVEPAPLSPPKSVEPEVVSDAEKIARLRRSVEADQKRRAELQAVIQDESGNFARAEAEFTEADKKLQALRLDLSRAKEAKDADAASRLEKSVLESQGVREMLLKRFEAVIAERKAAQEALASIELKIKSDQDAVDKLLGQPVAPTPAKPSDAPAAPPKTVPGTNLAPPSVASGTSANPPVGGPTAPGQTIANAIQSAVGTPLAAPSTSQPTAGADPSAPAGIPALPGATSGALPAHRKNDKVLQEAAEVAQEEAAAAQAAEDEARTLTERMDLLERNIDAERLLRDAARKRVDELDVLVDKASDELHRAYAEGKDAAEAADRLSEAEDRRREARRESRRISTHLDDLQTEYSRLQDEQITALEGAQRQRDRADAALQRLVALQNPLSPRNVLQWFIEHGPRILGTLIVVALVLWLSRLLGRRAVTLMIGRGMRDSLQERENRAHTLSGVLHSAITIGAVSVGIVTILEEFGVPVGPVMGGAAMIGLAVAFGAQSLIKDFFTGFMLLVEQQYLVNDVVKVGEISGQVERISLRMTVLRDIDGTAHFIPHGQITTVANMTHSWSRAVFDVAVSYRENVDRVIEELTALAQELRRDPQFGRLILEDVTMLGVDRLDDSSVVIKFFVKTKPLQQWTVKRELLRRIKNRFDELDIEIPFPQRTLHIREERREPSPVPLTRSRESSARVS